MLLIDFVMKRFLYPGVTAPAEVNSFDAAPT